MNRRQVLGYTLYVTVPTLSAIGYVLGKQNLGEGPNESGEKKPLFSRKPKNPTEVLEELVTACINLDSSKFEDLVLTNEDYSFLLEQHPNNEETRNYNELIRKSPFVDRFSLKNEMCFKYLEDMYKEEVNNPEQATVCLAEILRYDSEFHERGMQPEAEKRLRLEQEARIRSRGIGMGYQIIKICEKVARAYDTHQRITRNLGVFAYGKVTEDPKEYLGPFYFFSEQDIREIDGPKRLVKIVDQTITDLLTNPYPDKNPNLKENPDEANIAIVMCKEVGTERDDIDDNVYFVRVGDKWKASALTALSDYKDLRIIETQFGQDIEENTWSDE